MMPRKPHSSQPEGSDGGTNPNPPASGSASQRSSSSLIIICLVLSNLALGTLVLRGATPLQLTPPPPRPDGGSATNTFCSNPCGLACYGAGDECFQSCYETCSLSTTVRTGVLSPYLSLNAIQHVGVTVADLDRSVEWYTEVLGGVEVNSAGGNGWVGNDVEQLLMQHELLQGSPKSDFTAGLQDGGPDQLDARYVNFGPLQVELLDYHAQTGEEGDSNLPHYGTETAPSVAGNTVSGCTMSVCHCLPPAPSPLPFHHRSSSLSFSLVAPFPFSTLRSASNPRRL